MSAPRATALTRRPGHGHIRCVALWALLAAGCGPAEAPERAFVWARSADSATLDPAEAEWGEDLKVVSSLYETLVAVDAASLGIVPRLAERWSFAPDGSSASFELRDGVRFHDGTPFDSAAVVSSFARLLDPARSGRRPYAASFSFLEKVEADGPRRAVFRFRARSRLLLQVLTLPAAAIVSPAAADPARRPSGTGPYRLSRWDRDVRLELARFADYWGPKPGPARIIVVPVASPQTALEKLRKGEIHAYDHPSLGDVPALRAGPGTKVVAGPPVAVCCLGFNVRAPPYDDVEFRRAVALAVDPSALNAFAYRGLAVPAPGLVPAALGGGSPEPPAADLERAKAHLARAKLPSRQLELIHVSIPRPYMPEPARVAEYLKDRLGRIGLDVRLTAYDKGAYAQKTRDPAHPMFLLGWKGDYPDPDNYWYPLLHGDNAGDLNGSFFDDADFNAAVRAAQSEPDPERRRGLYAKAEARYRDLVPTIPLVHVPPLVALSARADYDPHPFELRFYQARLKPGD
jgi:ABC-type transport system substrate-binding protein